MRLESRPDPSPTQLEINRSERDPDPTRVLIYWPEPGPIFGSGATLETRTEKPRRSSGFHGPDRRWAAPVGRRDEGSPRPRPAPTAPLPRVEVRAPGALAPVGLEVGAHGRALGAAPRLLPGPTTPGPGRSCAGQDQGRPART
ncbi:hypothetical protein ISCGN_001070 [Ixodes scapularis]